MQTDRSNVDQGPADAPTARPAPAAAGQPGWLDSLRRWPRRRWAVSLGLTPGTVAAFLWVGAQLPPGAPLPPWSSALGVLAGVLAGSVLGSYVAAPGSGRLVDLGCSPCALASAGSVAAALVLRWTDPASFGLALASVAALGLGLARRLTDAASCRVPVR